MFLKTLQNMIQAIILSGGSGTRLWPISTNKLPKQFIELSHGATLLDRTMNRIRFLSPRPVIVANVSDKDIIDKLDCIPVYERYSNDTSVAIARGLEACEEDSIAIILPSDHNIENEYAFQESIRMGISKVKDDNIVLFGIKPTYPAIGFGYILGNNFKEKPQEDEAKQLILQGALWNAGIVAGKVSVLKNALQNDPQVYDYVHDPRSGKLNSFDVTVLQQFGNLHTVECNGWGWSDIGSHESFMALPEITKHILNQNSHKCDCENVTILNRGKGKICAIGVSDIKIIMDGDNILVMNIKSKDTILKNLISKL